MTTDDIISALQAIQGLADSIPRHTNPLRGLMETQDPTELVEDVHRVRKHLETLAPQAQELQELIQSVLDSTRRFPDPR